ncbi:MarR family transcriptional regulator [Novosphingobium sp. PASSN1]|jgi:DNA-binding MarR family transcriptional regulator|uniref:MarR family winged helix-turn-helix transcriptional regulator n=1 Tax=Novosphingobium sp. PASSN1 TaxID=2015561 RepID=UPI000BD038CA|nr:MarR family transcriptional regulator [Novosphingobium sp. PASSN1]OYU33672.1 MAG: MarR family transcriptional regulator [Novosphingobium sp. PASSN1]
MAVPHAKQSLRVWLRMLRATTIIEKRIRGYLKTEFDSTLPRFDVLSALDRETGPITMSQLTDHLLVSNGNLTGLVNRLVEDGLISREIDPDDRRVQHVVLTPEGRRAFREMADKHEALVDSLFAAMSDEDMATLLDLTTTLNSALQNGARPAEDA